MAAGGFSFGSPTTTTSTGFSFGFPNAGVAASPAQAGAAANLFPPSTTTLGQPSLGLGLQAPKSTALPLFGQTASTTTTSAPGLSVPTAFGFGLKTPTSSTSIVTGSSAPTPGLGFGISTTKPSGTLISSATPFSLGTTTTSSSAASPFSFGVTTPTQAATVQTPSTGLAVPASTGSSNSLTSAAATTTQSPFTLGLAAASGLKPFGTLPSFGVSATPGAQSPQTTTQPSQAAASSAITGSVQSPLQFSLKPATTPTSIIGSTQVSAGISGSTTSASLQVGLGTAAPQTSLPNLGFQSLATTTSTLGTTPVSSSTTSIGTGLGPSSSLFKSTTVATSSAAIPSPITFGLKTSTATSATSVASSLATAVTATTTTTAGTVAPGAAVVSKSTTLTYNQLEDLINKWACELEDQERYFLDEADRITQWDQALINNGEKITTLYEKVEGCKSEQIQIEKELDLIENQQKELESMLEPLERAANELPPGQLHSDFEREAIFQMASNVDLELGQLLSDLREMADQINSNTARLGLLGDQNKQESSAKAEGDSCSAKYIKSFNQSGESLSAVQQLTRILNCHMHSLNWIHHNSQELMERLKLLESGQAP